MKLLLLNYEFPPMGGGASNATYNIALELVNLGYSVDVLTSRFGDQASEEIVNGIRVYRVASWRRGIHECGLLGAASYVFFAFFKIRKLLKRNHYDLHHYFFGLPTGLLSLYSSGLLKKPYILSLRGSDVPGYDPAAHQLRYLHWIMKPILKIIWGRSERVVAISKGLQQLANETKPHQQIEIIHNGIDPRVFYPHQSRDNGSEHTLRALCVARLIERKGLEYLFQAVSKIRGIRLKLDIVGTGKDERKLKAVVKDLGIENRVSFRGYQTQAQLCQIYNEADVFILPSLTESFGIVLLEAMSCGLPIIASDVGGIPEVVSDNENGVLVPSGDVQAIIDAVLTLGSDRSARERISNNNLSKVRDQFTWGIVTKKYQDIYQEVIRENGN